MKRTLRVEEFSLQKAAGGGSILDAHFASGWVNFRCSFPFYTLFILNQNTKAYAGFRGDGIECDLVLGPKARPIPALGNAQGTRKPMRSKQLPSPTARPQDLLVQGPSGGAMAIV